MSQNQKLPPEIEKIRDDIRRNGCLKVYKDQPCPERKHLLDELASRAPEFDGIKAREYSDFKCEAEDYWSTPSFMHGARWQHQQTSLHYEAVIEKMKAEIERLRK